MNIHALRSFFFSSKRPDYPYLAVTQAPTPKNPLVAASSKRWHRSRISRSNPMNTLIKACRSREKVGIVSSSRL